jgi:quaternary ammonium compound-resistance protein SugE
MAWLWLGLATLIEIIWALSLKWAAMRTGWATASVPLALSTVNMAVLALAMRGMPAGVAYSIWTGAGAIGVTLLGGVLFGERIAAPQLACIALIVAGVAGMKLFAPT